MESKCSASTVLSSLSTSFNVEPELSISFDEQRALDSFLEDVDVLDQLQHANDCSEFSSPPKKKMKDAKPTKLATWKRRKEELQSLRSQVQDMQTHVAYLELEKTHAQLMDEWRDLTPEQKFWKAEAVNEKKRCHLAKHENARLKEKVEACQAVSSTLQIVLNTAELKQTEEVVFAALADRALRTELRTGHKLNLLSPVVFGLLNSAMSMRCNEIEAIIQESKMPTTRADTDQAVIYPPDKNEVDSMEFKRTQMLPYPVEQVSNAIWCVMKMGVIPDERSAQVSMKSDDAVEVEGYFTIPCDHGGTVDVRAYCFMKRIATSQGFMTLIETSTEWSTQLDSKHWRHVTRGSGWIAVYPLDTNNSIPGVSQVRTLTRLRATDTGGSQLKRSMSNEIVASFRKMTRSRHQLLDNVLLDTH
ncbi:hypothetical protein PHMEG_00021519 [Phytophthora megakarya]|uniref:M96 mating-specific protein n=1 Tax=Phytophthora megakarya TaxID=4795 RepID=A0A225VLE7_9STRA|nr:hypothetical protein PHMEG_00021519 [Phytophthora megakarya]